MSDLVEKIFDSLSVNEKSRKTIRYKVSLLLKTYEVSEIEDSLSNYVNSTDKPEFYKWFNEWKRYKTNLMAYKDDRPVKIMNEVLNDMEHRLQFYIGNTDLSFYKKIKNSEDLNSKLEYFEIQKDGRVNLNAGYIQQFYDFLYEKISEKIKPELWKITSSIGVENIISIYLRDSYYDLLNWKKSVSDIMDYPMNDIIDSVLSTIPIKIDFFRKHIEKLGVK